LALRKFPGDPFETLAVNEYNAFFYYFSHYLTPADMKEIARARLAHRAQIKRIASELARVIVIAERLANK